MKKLCIYGAGGSGKETLCCFIDTIANKHERINNLVCFMVDDNYYETDTVMGIEVIRKSDFKINNYVVVVSVGNSSLRRRMVESLPYGTKFKTIIHPSVIKSEWIEIGEGTIITSGCILTCNIKLGKHTQLNIGSKIGHDCLTGDYFTSGFGVCISGNCTFGNEVALGTNVCIKEKIKIHNNVIIGMGGVVVRSINESGTYVGNPVRKIK